MKNLNLFTFTKKMFWKSSKVPASFLLTTAAFATISLILLEKYKVREPVPEYNLKLNASTLTEKAFLEIQKERIRLGPAMDIHLDPQRSGLIGVDSSIITSKEGHLNAKQTSINPNWASVFIEMFQEAHLKSGDYVAAGMSGSFPALNIAFLIAAENFGLKPIIVSSIGASSYGANIPGLSWPEMESLLYQKGILHQKSDAITIGAKEDRGLDFPPEGLKLAQEIINKVNIQKLEGTKKSELIQARLDLFQEKSSNQIEAYINIGGGVASAGNKKIKNSFKPGLSQIEDTIKKGTNNSKDVDKTLDLGLMAYFKSENIPVINMINIDRLAIKYQLPLSPKVSPQIGIGTLYYKYYYFGPAIVVILLMILVLLIWQINKARKLQEVASY